MRKPVVLITGAGGEIGHGLVTCLAASGSPIITLDVSPLDASLAPLVRREFTPVTAHHVNVEGTLNLLEFAQHEGESHGRPVVFIYPSSVAAYGLPSLEVKRRAGAVAEDDYNRPTTMYGCNKLYC